MVRVIRHGSIPRSHARTCAHPHCHTSLNEYAVECPHGLPFCEHCTWEDGCDECVLEPMRQRAAAAWEHAAEPQPWIDPVRDAAADTWAELHATERDYGLAQLEDREEGISA